MVVAVARASCTVPVASDGRVRRLASLVRPCDMLRRLIRVISPLDRSSCSAGSGFARPICSSIHFSNSASVSCTVTLPRIL